MAHALPQRWITLAVVCIMTVCGCATFDPQSVDEAPFRERTQTQLEGNVRVTAAVPGAKESRKIFGVSLYDDRVQPIWLEIENRDDDPVWFLPLGLDPDYFTPFEAAYLNHFVTGTYRNEEMNRFFHERGMGIYLAPGSVRSGFAFTQKDLGTKEFTVDLIGEDHQLRSFTFFIDVPGLRADHHEIDFDELYQKDEVVSLDEKGLTRALKNLPCCTTNKKNTAQGDPLNLIVIGDEEDLFHAFIRSDWDETETIYTSSAWKTFVSFLFGGRYRYSPVSTLYVYGRPQDLALQKARDTIHERNHLRLWLSPMRFEGEPVWVGQISRDIGVRFTSKTIVTHKIDPDVDETRDYLLWDLLYSQGLTKFAYVKGTEAAPFSEPRSNLTGDPYFTDGYRAVLWVSSDPVDLEEVEFVKWGVPPGL